MPRLVLHHSAEASGDIGGGSSILTCSKGGCRDQRFSKAAGLQVAGGARLAATSWAALWAKEGVGCIMRGPGVAGG